MTRYRITTPVPGYTGEIAGVHVIKGVAELDAPDPLPRLDEETVLSREERTERTRIGQDPAYRAMAYFRAQGYGVDVLDAEPPPTTDGGKVPPRSASKAEWKTYAVTTGMSDDQADGLTRDQLADRFMGTKEVQP